MLNSQFYMNLDTLTLNCGAVVVEDLVCAVFGGMVGKRGATGGPGWQLKVVGYVWVFAFLVLAKDGLPEGVLPPGIASLSLEHVAGAPTKVSFAHEE